MKKQAKKNSGKGLVCSIMEKQYIATNVRILLVLLGSGWKCVQHVQHLVCPQERDCGILDKIFTMMHWIKNASGGPAMHPENREAKMTWL
eukprot:9336026-Ditylum_brightwellii.AAC.1